MIITNDEIITAVYEKFEQKIEWDGDSFMIIKNHPEVPSNRELISEIRIYIKSIKEHPEIINK